MPSFTYRQFVLCCAAGAALTALACAPVGAQQPPPAQGQTGDKSGGQAQGKPVPAGDRMVSLDVDNGRLVDILPNLLKSVDTDYALDGDVRDIRASIHISKAKLNDTLDSLMKVCSRPVYYAVEDGVYHFATHPLARHETAPATDSNATPEPARRPGPRYNGGDPIAVAVSDLMAFLAGSEFALAGKSPFPNNNSDRAGSGSLSGSRKYSEYGFINGKITSSGFTTPDIGDPYSTTVSGGYGYFGPIVIGGSRGR